MNTTTPNHPKALSQATPVSQKKKAFPAFALVGICLLLPDYGQAGLFDKALNFGKDVLGKAALNYSNKYEKKLNQLLQSLQKPVVGNQPFIQGITPSDLYNPNASYGTGDTAYSNPYGGDPYGQQPGYNQGTQQGGYYGQTPQSGYPADPNNGGYSSNDPYAQNPGYSDPYNSNQGYSQEGIYGQNQGGFPNDSNYGGYPQTGQQDGGYGQYPNQGYPADPNYGNDPYATPNQYGQSPGGYPAYDPNQGSSGYPSATKPQQGGQDPYNQYGGGGYPGQPTPPAQQQGMYDPYQPQASNPPQQPAYTQPSNPQYPTDPRVQTPDQPATQAVEGLQLDVALVKKTMVNGAETLLPIQDGDVLEDGRGNAQAGDKFRMMFRAKTDCYVYVIAIDGSAWAQGVFPSLTSPFDNPVKQGQQYVIPEGNNWFSLDQFKGIETVFFVASPEKRPDIEEILASIAGRERNPITKPQPVTEAPIIPAGFHHSQQSSTPFIIGQDGASDPGVLPTTYFTQKAGEALRVTRWFQHQ